MKRTGKYCFRRPTSYPWDQTPAPGTTYTAPGTIYSGSSNKGATGGPGGSSTYIIPMLSTATQSASATSHSTATTTYTSGVLTAQSNATSAVRPQNTGTTYSNIATNYMQQYQQHQQHQQQQQQQQQQQSGQYTQQLGQYQQQSGQYMQQSVQYPQYQQQQQTQQQLQQQQQAYQGIGGYSLAGPPSMASGTNPGMNTNTIRYPTTTNTPSTAPGTVTSKSYLSMAGGLNINPSIPNPTSASVGGPVAGINYGSRPGLNPTLSATTTTPMNPGLSALKPPLQVGNTTAPPFTSATDLLYQPRKPGVSIPNTTIPSSNISPNTGAMYNNMSVPSTTAGVYPNPVASMNMPNYANIPLPSSNKGGKKNAPSGIPYQSVTPTAANVLNLPMTASMGPGTSALANSYISTPSAGGGVGGMYPTTAGMGQLMPPNSGMLTLNMNNVPTYPRPSSVIAPTATTVAGGTALTTNPPPQQPPAK